MRQEDDPDPHGEQAEGGGQPAEFRIPTAGFRGSREFRIPASEPQPAARVPSDHILFPRRMFYVEAALYLVVAVGAFGLGYLIGRGRGTDTAGTGQKNLAQSRVPVEGRVRCDRGGGALVADEGAVVIVLPARKYPSPRLPAAALHPSQPPLGQGSPEVLRIRELGGAVTRADDAGNFSFFVPARGEYRVLVVSRRAARPAGGPSAADREEMAKYFDAIDRLLDGCQYRWTLDEIKLPMQPIDVVFRSGS